VEFEWDPAKARENLKDAMKKEINVIRRAEAKYAREGW